MYIPHHFFETRRDVIRNLIHNYNFATLISHHKNGELAVTHIPFSYDENKGENGTLQAHMSRANPHWQCFEESRQESLVIFNGPHHYISPSWYEEDMKNVPTWNYAVVHMKGFAKIITDEKQVELMMRELVDANEEKYETGWKNVFLDDYQYRLLRAIVAFEIPVTSIEAKLKLSQNRTTEDREKVIKYLSQYSSDLAKETALLMQQIGKKT